MCNIEMWEWPAYNIETWEWPGDEAKCFLVRLQCFAGQLSSGKTVVLKVPTTKAFSLYSDIARCLPLLLQVFASLQIAIADSKI